jgi:universal stress protein A
VKEDPAKAEEPITRILLAVDFSAHSDRAVEIAAGLAKRFGATVDALHAFELPGEYIPFASPFGVELARKVEVSASEMLESACERLQNDQLSVRLHVRRGRPSLVIAELAEETGCQLIVMGTRGNSGLAHVLLGSVAERTLRIAPCSVLVAHAESSRDRE